MQIVILIGAALTLTQIAHAETYDCRTNFIAEKQSVFSKQFVVDSKAETTKAMDLKFKHKSQKYMVDCGIINQPDHDDNFVCGLSAWSSRAKG